MKDSGSTSLLVHHDPGCTDENDTDETILTPTPTSPSSDATPPTLSSIAVSNITEVTATISWSTNEQSTSQVDYGVDTTYSL